MSREDVQDMAHSHATGARASRIQAGRVALKDAYNRIVATSADGAIMHQEGICQRSEALAGFVVIYGDWLFAQVATGHHQGGERIRAGGLAGEGCK